MNRTRITMAVLAAGALALSSCGYSTRSALPSRLRTVFIEDFKNSIDYTSQTRRNLYFPLLEVKIKKAIINRFLFDGNLRIADAGSADLVLEGELVNYERAVLRYTDNDDPQEYRVYITANLKMVDRDQNEVLWEEPGFVGEATYFVQGAQAKSENAAIEDATVDFARRVVERTIENW